MHRSGLLYLIHRLEAFSSHLACWGLRQAAYCASLEVEAHGYLSKVVQDLHTYEIGAKGRMMDKNDYAGAICVRDARRKVKSNVLCGGVSRLD